MLCWCETPPHVRLRRPLQFEVSCYLSNKFCAVELTIITLIFLDKTEYGMGKHASSEGDVYSFGVILLEIVTGKRPTDVLIHEGSSLHEWVKIQYTQPHKLENIVQQALQRCSLSCVPRHDTKILEDVMLELIELGLLCTQNNPSTRPTMLDVAQEMGRLKDYLNNSFSREHNLLEK